MYLVTIYGYDRVIEIVCATYLDALNERNLRQGMGLAIEITKIRAI